MFFPDFHEASGTQTTGVVNFDAADDDVDQDSRSYGRVEVVVCNVVISIIGRCAYTLLSHLFGLEEKGVASLLVVGFEWVVVVVVLLMNDDDNENGANNPASLLLQGSFSLS